MIAGVPTTVPYHLLILDNEAFVRGDVDTGFIVKHGDTLTEPPPIKGLRIVEDAAKRAAARKKKAAR